MTLLSSIEIPTKEKKKIIQNKEKSQKMKTGPPKDFTLTPHLIEWAKIQGCNGNLKKITESFLDYHGAKGSKFKDWTAAWRNWIRKDIEFKGYDAYQSNKKEITMDNVRVLYEN